MTRVTTSLFGYDARVRALLAALFLVLVLILGLGSATAAPAHADDPPTAVTPAAVPAPGDGPTSEGATSSGATNTSGGVLSFLPDPRQWVGEVFERALTAMLQAMTTALHRVISGVMGSSLNFITQTPPAGSYANPTVQALWGTVRAIANAALALIALWGGFHLIVRPQLGSPYHEAMELFPRLALGALLANTSLAWAQLAIDANNALCQAIGQATLPAWEHAGAATQLLVDVLAALIYLVVSLLLLLQMLMRLALVNVLLVVSPLALLCWVLPETGGWARLWSSLFLSSVFTQFVQVLALKLGASLLTELTPMVPDAALLAVFLGVAVLVLTLKIPDLMRGHLGDGLGFVRYYVYRRGASALEGGRGSGGAPTGRNGGA